MLKIRQIACAMNMVFMGFSVRKVPLKQLWRLKWNKNFDITKPPPEWPDWMQNLSGDYSYKREVFAMNTVRYRR